MQDADGICGRGGGCGIKSSLCTTLLLFFSNCVRVTNEVPLCLSFKGPAIPSNQNQPYFLQVTTVKAHMLVNFRLGMLILVSFGN